MGPCSSKPSARQGTPDFGVDGAYTLVRWLGAGSTGASAAPPPLRERTCALVCLPSGSDPR